MLGLPAFQMETSRFIVKSMSTYHSVKKEKHSIFFSENPLLERLMFNRILVVLFVWDFHGSNSELSPHPTYRPSPKSGKKAGGLPCPAVNLGRVNFPRQLKERYDNFKEAFEAFDPRFGPAAIREGVKQIL